MKASRFTDAQKAFIIKQGEDGKPVAEQCREAGISQVTYFNWKKIRGSSAVRDETPERAGHPQKPVRLTAVRRI
ncbi:hypothetical protein IWQ51_002082 [Labrenzia sp. EL_142]|nr:hypothetical protein [Labrenzia sp. EL_142]